MTFVIFPILEPHSAQGGGMLGPPTNLGGFCGIFLTSFGDSAGSGNIFTVKNIFSCLEHVFYIV